LFLLFFPRDVRSCDNLVKGGVERIIREQAPQEGKPLIKGWGVSRFVNRKALLRRCEALHDHFRDFIRDIAEHPSEIRQVIKLSRAHFQLDSSQYLAICGYGDGKSACVEPRAEPSRFTVCPIGLEELRSVCFDSLDDQRQRYLVPVLFAL
jgi:hypothetical protein